MDERNIAFKEPSFLIRINKTTPRKISSSNKTDLIFHQSPEKISLTEISGFNCQTCFAKYIFIKKPDAQKADVKLKNRRKSITRFLLGPNPKTDKFPFSKNQISNQETAS